MGRRDKVARDVRTEVVKRGPAHGAAIPRTRQNSLSFLLQRERKVYTEARFWIIGPDHISVAQQNARRR